MTEQLWSGAEYSVVFRAVRSLDSNLRGRVVRPVRECLKFLPDSLGGFACDLGEIDQRLSKLAKETDRYLRRNQTVGDRPFLLNLEPTERERALLKLALLHWRRERGSELDTRRGKTKDPEVLAWYDFELDCISYVLGHESFQGIEAARMPKASDYLPTTIAERMLDVCQLIDRKYDEKFGLLLSPELVNGDLEVVRQRCELRGLPFCLALLDIDNFKGFNTEFGNEIVDREILPRFMEVVESLVFGRGYAYRQGGDEYFVLLPNVDAQEAERIFDRLRDRLLNVEYGLTLTTKPTASIGAVIVDPDSLLTTREIREQATKSMAEAKDCGRNRTATSEARGETTRPTLTEASLDRLRRKTSTVLSDPLDDVWE